MVNTTWEVVHIQFPIRKLIFTIIPIAREGSIKYVKTISIKSAPLHLAIRPGCKKHTTTIQSDVLYAFIHK